MVYLYAGMGVVMLTGIMAIFEMGLALTGQSLLPIPADPYVSDFSMKGLDKTLLEFLSDRKKLRVVVEFDGIEQEVEKTFSAVAGDQGLCSALNQIDDQGWTLIREGRWINSCQLNQGSHRAVVKENSDDERMPYQLFSCALSGGNDRCSFERE